MPLQIVLYIAFTFITSIVSATTLLTPEQIASAHGLTASTALPFPTATLAPADTDKFIISGWTLNKNKIQNQPSDIQFVNDPFPNSAASLSNSSTATSPVFRVTYPSQSFGDRNGGSQFFSLFNGSMAAQSMMVSYEVAFDEGFQFVKGGKLPGLRGGPVTNGCDGGSTANGTNCWSVRLMWRAAGDGEAYAYILDSANLCNDNNVICNSDDFGTSIGRGSFSFISGQWQQLSLVVELNSKGDLANGNIILYYNGLPVVQQQNLQFRGTTNLLANGLFFSTFFGGNDSSWASPTEQHSYFRNFQLWASSQPSNSTGVPVSNGVSVSTQRNLMPIVVCGLFSLLLSNLKGL